MAIILIEDYNDYIKKEPEKELDTTIEFFALFKMMEVLISRNYIDKLALKKRQLVYIDEYGDKRDESWQDELDDFVDRKFSQFKKDMETVLDEDIVKFAKFIRKDECLIFTHYDIENAISHLRYLINYCVSVFMDCVQNNVINEKVIDEPESSESSSHEISPLDFEVVIKTILDDYEWETYLTPVTGDQGADIIASKYGLKAAIQCKYYSSPVGNDAVQQVYAAKEYYNANFAIVVTNSSYTKSARQLAESLSVILLDQHGLYWFANKVEEEQDK